MKQFHLALKLTMIISKQHSCEPFHWAIHIHFHCYDVHEGDQVGGEEGVDYKERMGVVWEVLQ